MAASAIVPLTITYTPPSGALTTATVLGQVLNNGGTNWIPTGTSDNAIYLETAGSGPSTVLDGTTYYLSNGPAVPAQVTISASMSSPASASSAGGTGGMGSMSSSMMGGSGAASSSSGMGMGSMGASSSSSSSASAAASSSTGGVSGPVAPGASVAGVLVAILAVFGL